MREKYESLSLGALKEIARARGMKGLSSLKKSELVERMLQEDEKDKKMAEKRNEAITTVYWCVVTAVYLGWSFHTMEWQRTWIIWPCAAVLFGAVLGVSGVIRKK